MTYVLHPDDPGTALSLSGVFRLVWDRLEAIESKLDKILENAK